MDGSSTKGEQIMATGIGGEVLWICPTLSFYNGINDLSGNISTPSTHSGANVISETGEGGTHSISFNGTQGLDLGSPTIHSGSTFSYSCWFKTTQSINTGGGAGLIGQYLIHDDRGPCLALNNAQPWFYYQSVGTSFNSAHQTNSSSTANDGNWHHAAVVFEGSSGTAKLYIDGSLVATGSSVPSSVNQTRNLFLGDMNNGLLNGSMDDVRAFNRVLTEQEIELLAIRRGYEPTNGIGDEVIWSCPSIDDTVYDIAGNFTPTQVGTVSVVNNTDNGGSKVWEFPNATAGFAYGRPSILTESIFPLSISVWVQLYAGHGNRTIFGGYNNLQNSNLHYLLRSDGAVLRTFAINTSGGFSSISGPTLSTTSLTHIVTTLDSNGDVNYYVNGTLDSSGTFTNLGVAQAPATPVDYNIATKDETATDESFYGIMDDFRFFNRVITASEITSLASTRGYTTGGGGGGEGEAPATDPVFHPFTSFHVIDA